MIISNPSALANLFVFINSKNSETDLFELKKNKNSFKNLIKTSIEPKISDTINLKENLIFFSSVFNIDMESSEIQKSILSDNTIKFFFESINHHFSQLPEINSNFNSFSNKLSEILHLQLSNNISESKIDKLFDMVKKFFIEHGKEFNNSKELFKEIEVVLKTIGSEDPSILKDSAKNETLSIFKDSFEYNNVKGELLKEAVLLYDKIHDKMIPINLKEFEVFLNKLDENINSNKNLLLQKLINISFLEINSVTVNDSGLFVEGDNGQVYLNSTDISFLEKFVGQSEIKEFIMHLSDVFSEKEKNVSSQDLKYSRELQKILVLLSGLESIPDDKTKVKDLLTALALNSTVENKNFLTNNSKLLLSILKELLFEIDSGLKSDKKDYLVSETNYNRLIDILNSKENVLSSRQSFKEFIQIAMEFMNLNSSNSEPSNESTNKMFSRVLNEMVANFCVSEQGESFAIPFHCQELDDFMVFYERHKKNRNEKKPKKRFSLSFATEKLGPVTVDIVSGSSVEVYLKAKKENTRKVFTKNIHNLHKRLEVVQSKSVKTF